MNLRKPIRPFLGKRPEGIPIRLRTPLRRRSGTGPPENAVGLLEVRGKGLEREPNSQLLDIEDYVEDLKIMGVRFGNVTRKNNITTNQ